MNAFGSGHAPNFARSTRISSASEAGIGIVCSRRRLSNSFRHVIVGGSLAMSSERRPRTAPIRLPVASTRLPNDARSHVANVRCSNDSSSSGPSRLQPSPRARSSPPAPYLFPFRYRDPGRPELPEQPIRRLRQDAPPSEDRPREWFEVLGVELLPRRDAGRATNLTTSCPTSPDVDGRSRSP